MPSTVAYLVRHAQSQPDPQAPTASWPLSPRGRLQARWLGRRLRSLGVEVVASSPWPRAVDTVAPLARRLGVAVETAADLRERRIAPGWLDDFEAEQRRSLEDPDHALPGCEPGRSAAARLEGAMEALRLRHPGRTLVVATHGHALAHWLQRLDPGFGFDAWRGLAFPHVLRVVHDGRRWGRDPDFSLAPPEAPGEGPLGEAFRQAVASLEEPAAAASLARDPYWPKWDSPWWVMALLDEMGLPWEIPPGAAVAMAERLDAHYLHHFPIQAHEVPAGVDPQMQVMCLCGLGTMLRVLDGAGVDVDQALPWARRWWTRYQLPDGGYNCDEAAYARARPASSMVSTVPMLEALLAVTERPLTADERQVLGRGVAYLVDRRLLFSRRSGALIDPDWRRLCFPRFYHYDALRGLALLLEARGHGIEVPEAALAPGWELLPPPGAVAPERRSFEGEGSRVWQGGAWDRGAARLFPLLEQISRPGVANPWLARRLEALRPHAG